MKKQALLVLAALCFGSLLPKPSLATPETDLKAALHTQSQRINDLRAELAVTYANDKELKHIGDNYAKIYQIKKGSLAFLAPDNWKVEGSVGVVKLYYVVTQKSRVVKVPKVGLRKEEDITAKPFKRLTALDMGMVLETLFSDFKVENVSRQQSDGLDCYVVDMLAPVSNYHETLCIDAQKLCLVRRDKDTPDRKLNVRFLYSKPAEVAPGVWVPTNVNLYSDQEKLASSSVLSDIKVNTGLSAKEFQL